LPQSDSPTDDAAAKLAELLPPAAVDALLADAEESGTPIDGPDGLLAQMTKAVLERALDVEIADHSRSPIIWAMTMAIRPATARATRATDTAAKPC
jgi:hypothetical protein